MTPPPARATSRPSRRAGARAGRRAGRSCPNDLDPTVFDEGFLRQLERLGVLMKQPVRGGLRAAGGR